MVELFPQVSELQNKEIIELKAVNNHRRNQKQNRPALEHLLVWRGVQPAVRHRTNYLPVIR